MGQPIEQGREAVGEGEEEKRGVFDPGIHLAFMVWRRLSSPLNFVFRWREPERWEGDCGAGVRSPLIWEAHVLGQNRGRGGLCPEISENATSCHWKCLLGWILARYTLRGALILTWVVVVPFYSVK